MGNLRLYDHVGGRNALGELDGYGYGGWTTVTNFSLNGACYSLTTDVLPAIGGTLNTTAQNCTGGYTAGTVVQVSLSANEGYVFTGWSGAAGGTTAKPCASCRCWRSRGRA